MTFLLKNDPEWTKVHCEFQECPFVKLFSFAKVKTAVIIVSAQTLDSQSCPRSQLGPWLFWSPRNLVPQKFGTQKILGPTKFGPREIWSPGNLVAAWKSLYGIFMQGPSFLEPKFVRDQISWGPNFLGTKKVRGPNEIGDHFSHSQSGESVKFIKKSDSRLRCLHALCTWPQVLAGMCPPVHHWGFWLSGQHHYLYCLKRTGM